MSLSLSERIRKRSIVNPYDKTFVILENMNLVSNCNVALKMKNIGTLYYRTPEALEHDEYRALHSDKISSLILKFTIHNNNYKVIERWLFYLFLLS